MSDVSMQPVIPEAVRRQSLRADALAREASEVAAREAGQPPPEGGETPQPERQGDRPPERQGERPQPEHQQDRQVQPGGPPAEPAKDLAYWEQRAKTMEGKYNAEVPSLAARLRVSEGQLNTLHNTVAELNMRRANEAPAQQAPTVAADGISPEDVESYGQDFIDKVRGWTTGTTNAEIARLKAEVEALRGATQNTSVKLTQQQVAQALDIQLPGWRETNDDPLFLEWLNQIDPFSGQIRLGMLQSAYTSGDVARTGNFFSAYQREHTATQARGDPPAHTSTSGAGTVPLADLAAPGRGRPANPGAPADKRLWTHPQIAAFYRDLAAGKYAGNVDAKNRIEADIFAAGSEGRIR